MTSTDRDRMQPTGSLTYVSFASDGQEHRENFLAYRDYDLVHLPAVVTDLDGIDQARTVLDTAERDITAYQVREGDAEQVLARYHGKRLGRALAALHNAVSEIAELTGDACADVTDPRWGSVISHLGSLPFAGDGTQDVLNGLRRALAVIAGDAPDTEAPGA